MLKKFISYYKPHRKVFILDMISSFLLSISGLVYPIISRTILNDFIPNKKISLIIYAGIVLVFIYIIRMMLTYYISYYGHVMGVKMQAQMRDEMFIHLQKLPYKYYDNNQTGKIMSRMTNDLHEVSELAHHGPENLFICGFMILATLGYLSTIEWHLTLIIAFFIPILIIIALSMKKRLAQAFTETRKDTADINGAIATSISGIRITKAYLTSEYELKKFSQSNNAYVASRSKAYRVMGQSQSLITFVTSLFNLSTIIFGSIFIYKDLIDFADLTAFIISINLFVTPLITLINFNEQYQSGVTGFKRFLEILEEQPETDLPDAVEINDVLGKIDFVNVGFSYDTTENKEVLNNINLNILPGKKIALVGESGSGKTTICNLLLRFYEIGSGNIYIDNQDIYKIKLESLRKNIGIVQQEVFLFEGTFKENILYGNLNSSFEDVVLAAKKANIHDYIMSLPLNYDTQIGERGVRLSGGQRQRLSIARIFLKNPKILILDEATSALDNNTEALIQEELNELCKDRTTLIVAHRLSTIKNVDKIVVMDKGEIVEIGSHNELVNLKGYYESLYNKQFQDKILELNN